MSKEDKRGGEDRLKDLLNKGTPEDDFEREAREGFALLGSEEEAMALKAKVDRRMKEEVLKERRPLRPWLAAAALLLLVGFSVYMVSDFKGDENNVAIGYKERNEQVEPLPQVASPGEKRPESPAGAVPERRPSKDEAVKDAGKEKSPVGEMEKKAAGRPTPPPVQISERADGEALAADAAMTPGEPVAETRQAAAEQQLSMTTPETINAQMAPVNTATMEREQYQGATPQTHGKYMAKKKTASEAPTVMTPAAVVSLPVFRAVYPGGNDSLCAFITRKMAGQAGKYDALLIVDGTGKVRKAEITDRYGLTGKEKKAIEEVLLTIDGFTIQPAADAASRAEYRLKCRP